MHRLKAEIFLLLCTVLWGGTFLAIKLVVVGTPPILLVALRFSLAALLYLLVFHRQIRKSSRRDVRRGMALGVLLLASFGLQTLGLQYTSITRSAFITQLIVIFTPAFQWMIFGRLPMRSTLLGVAVVLVGMFFLTSPQGSANLNYGDFLTLLCALSFSLYMIYIDRYSTPENAAALSFDQTLFVALFAWIGTLFFEADRFPDEARVDLLLGLLYLSPLATNLVVYWQTRWQPQSTPARAAVIFAMEPVFATLFAVIFVSEALTWRSGIGAALIFTGLLISELGPIVAGRRRAPFIS